MKCFFISLLMIVSQFVSSQDDNESIIKSAITNSNEKSFIFENDENGNKIFSKNVGMNGPITMIFAAEYDDLNRKTKSFSVHSNFGFSLSEKVYEKDCVKNYKYTSNSGNSHSYDRATLNGINSQKEFIQMKVFYALQRGKKTLRSIEYLDSKNNVIKELYISKNGDTASINIYKYNSKNQKVFIGSDTRAWDIYNLYDDNFNKIKSFRTTSCGNCLSNKDTTEVYNYYYNSKNQMTSEDYYNKGDFKNKEEYFYNSDNQIIKKLFYGRDQSEIDVKTILKYDKKRSIKKKIVKDYRNPKGAQKKVFKTRLKYW